MFSDTDCSTFTGISLFTAATLLHTWLASSTQEGKKKEHYLQLTAANFHFTRKCNYKCGFCFHTAKTSHVETLENCKLIIKALRDHGCKKINFAGGEPFLPDYTSKPNKRTDLGEMVKYAKSECHFESVSVISNGRYITEEWMERYHSYLNVLGVSCDSVNEATNKSIGRGSGDHQTHVKHAAALCRKFNVPFKLNTVVCSLNWDEDLSALIAETQPMRWKIFQVLPLQGENCGEGSKRNVDKFLISDAQFRRFVTRHEDLVADPRIMKIENNSTMQSSYVLVDEYGCFLDSSLGGKIPTKSILDEGIAAAWAELEASAGGGFDQVAFDRRDGNFFSSPATASGAPLWLESTNTSCAGCAPQVGTVMTADIEDLGL